MNSYPLKITWIDRDFLKSIANEIINLYDYVPLDIAKGLPDFEERKKWIHNHESIIDDEYMAKQIIDQCSAGTTWEEHVKIYDEFFDKYPQYRSIINNEEGYKEWKENDPFE